MFSKYSEILKQLEDDSNLRQLKSGDDDCVNLSSNDYLGLAGDILLKKKFFKERDIHELDFTSSSSRLLTGNHSEYNKLEDTLAELYSQPAALVFNSGYHANIGILPALCGKKDLILADKAVHASIIDGLRLSNATVVRYQHNNYVHLEKLLKKYSDNIENIFIVTESIFSMDGDIADIKQLVELKKKYNAFLYLDEAHAVGARGIKGLGLAEELSLIKEIDFLIGTFGKALASQGAFLICNKVIKQYLINTSRSLIFTTALPPINVAWSLFIMKNIADYNDARKRLKENSETFCNILGIDKPQSNIIPLILGENEKAILLSGKLKKYGINAMPVRYPTVPKGTARIRFSLTADLNKEEIIDIANRIKVLMKE